MRQAAVVFLFLITLTVPALAAEDCSKLGGKCRAVCGASESSEQGAFEDCTIRELCCVPGSAADAVKCCVLSFSARVFGPDNCVVPGNGKCEKGSASPASCDKLAMCRK